MKAKKITYRSYAVFLLLGIGCLITSCNIEKRVYTGGYYIHIPLHVKNEVTQKENTSLSCNLHPAAEVKTVIAVKPEITPNTIGSNSDDIYKPNGNTKKISQTILKVSAKNIPEARASFRSDDEEEGVKKDVRGLLFGSCGTVLGAALYGVFLSAGVISLANLFFVLTPFAIIGMWIYSLLLHDKYSQEALAISSGKKKERVYTQHKAFLLAGFLGIFGAHRFYLGYTKMGFLEMFTLGGFFILFFIDFIRIKQGMLKPMNGDYEKSTSTYTRSNKNKVKSRSLKLIRVAMMISVAALLLFLGLAFFL